MDSTQSTGLSKVDLSFMLRQAGRLAKATFADSPLIWDQLSTCIKAALSTCEQGERSPQDLLNQVIRNERLIIKAFNEGKLCGPLGASHLSLGTIPDAIPWFPIRSTAMSRGFPFEYPGPLNRPADAGLVVLPKQFARMDPTVAALREIPCPVLSKPRETVPAKRGRRPAAPEPRPESPRVVVQAPTPTPTTTTTTAVTQTLAPATVKRRKFRGKSAEQKALEQVNKLYDAPSYNLPFPNGNITAVEILTFLPTWIKSWDVIERFCSNGGTAAIMAYIINEHRVQGHGAMYANAIYHMMKGSMAYKKGDENKSWTFRKHKVPEDWDDEVIDVSRFRIPRETHAYPPNNWKKNEEAKPVSFMSLADGVKKLPTGDDALDLTLCVEWHLQNPEEEAWFPNDYQKLVEMLGGPKEVQLDNWDRTIFHRYKRRHAAHMKRRRIEEGAEKKRKARKLDAVIGLDDDASGTFEEILQQRRCKKARKQGTNSGLDLGLSSEHQEEQLRPEIDTSQLERLSFDDTAGLHTELEDTSQSPYPVPEAPMSPEEPNVALDDPELVYMDGIAEPIPPMRIHQAYLDSGLWQQSLPSAEVESFDAYGDRYLRTYPAPVSGNCGDAAENIRWAQRTDSVNAWTMTDADVDFQRACEARAGECFFSLEVIESVQISAGAQQVAQQWAEGLVDPRLLNL
ncbi:hypothetical protein BDV96DRAFT_640221 [Lophiotrema nucula]|uniref:Uncharacterized protein n=1 Tax=Lophiotrema nucula TaxID=690887 RepID=A0A6A5ZUZ9_9PLEO|nr:hypothetical protein BDV96DRAFT_640221 [Lophiotrema nucula]